MAAARSISFFYALWLFKNAKLTIGKAAELARLDIYDFMTACKQNQVSIIDISREKLLEEISSM